MIDAIDRRILTMMQGNGRIANAEIARAMLRGGIASLAAIVRERQRACGIALLAAMG